MGTFASFLSDWSIRFHVNYGKGFTLIAHLYKSLLILSSHETIDNVFWFLKRNLLTRFLPILQISDHAMSTLIQVMAWYCQNAINIL